MSCWVTAHSFLLKTFGCWGISAAPIALVRADEPCACKRKVPFHLFSKLFLLVFVISPVSHPIINNRISNKITWESWAGVRCLHSRAAQSHLAYPSLGTFVLGDSRAHNVPIFHHPEPIPHPVTPGRGRSMAVFTSVWSGPRFAY